MGSSQFFCVRLLRCAFTILKQHAIQDLWARPSFYYTNFLSAEIIFDATIPIGARTFLEQ